MQYVMLISSLPYLPFPLTLKQPPLSRLQLQQRLNMLTPEDTLTLGRIHALMSWSGTHLAQTDQQLVESFEQLAAELQHTDLARLVRARFELLTVLAALRRRHNDQPAPARGSRWGDERWVSHIERHWREPGFGLQNTMPWIAAAEHCLESDDPVGLERLIISTAWQHLAQAGEGHYFDFTAVMVYVLRFDLVESSVGWDPDMAKTYFQELLLAGRGNYRERLT